MQGYNRQDFATRLVHSSGLLEKSHEERNWSSHFRPFYLGLITSCQIVLCLILPAISVYHNWEENVLAVLENIFICFMFAHFLTKSSVFFYWGEPMKKLASTLEEMYLDYHRDHSVLSQTEQEIFDWTKWLVMISVKSGLGFSSVAYVAYIVCSTVAACYERKIYLTFWFPWDETASPIFEITLLLIGITTFLGFTYLVLGDVFLMTILLHTYGHLKLLQYNLTNIRELSDEEVQEMTAARQHEDRETSIELIGDHGETHGGMVMEVQETVIVDTELEILKCTKKAVVHLEPCDRVQDIDNDLSRNYQVNVVMKRRLKESIRHHRAIISFVGDMKLAFDAYMAIQIIINFVLSGSLALWLTLTPHLGVKEVFMFMFMVGLYVELALGCVIANVITDESSGVREAVYGSDWFGASEGFKRSMRIMMSMANQPLVITCANQIPLSNEMLMKIAKLTYSHYMTMLACITGKSDLGEKRAH